MEPPSANFIFRRGWQKSTISRVPEIDHFVPQKSFNWRESSPGVWTLWASSPHDFFCGFPHGSDEGKNLFGAIASSIGDASFLDQRGLLKFDGYNARMLVSDCRCGSESDAHSMSDHIERFGHRRDFLNDVRGIALLLEQHIEMIVKDAVEVTSQRNHRFAVQFARFEFGLCGETVRLRHEDAKRLAEQNSCGNRLVLDRKRQQARVNGSFRNSLDLFVRMNTGKLDFKFAGWSSAGVSHRAEKVEVDVRGIGDDKRCILPAPRFSLARLHVPSAERPAWPL